MDTADVDAAHTGKLKVPKVATSALRRDKGSVREAGREERGGECIAMARQPTSKRAACARSLQRTLGIVGHARRDFNFHIR